MSCEQETILALRAAGRRCTIPRLKVASVLQHAGGHLTAEAIQARIQRDDPQAAIALSTVYRTLEALEELRIVASAEASGRSTYQWIDRSHPHHHLVCRRCGADAELAPAIFERFEHEILASAGFQPHLDHLSITGVCAACRAADGE